MTSIKATKWQYTNGVKDLSLVSPDTWTLDQALLDRPAKVVRLKGRSNYLCPRRWRHFAAEQAKKGSN